MERAELAPAEPLAMARMLVAQAKAVEAAEPARRMAAMEARAALPPGTGRCRR